MTEVCGRQPFGGGACELDKGHDGPHQKTRAIDGKPWVFHWTDESQSELVRRGKLD